MSDAYRWRDGGAQQWDAVPPPTDDGAADPVQHVDHDAVRPAGRGDDRDHTEVEQAVPLAERLRARAAGVTAVVRSSIPIRTVAFVLPPLVLPPLAFDLSVGETIVVALLLLWLAGAAGVLAAVMSDGADQLALRAIARRLSQPTRPTDDQVGEALLAVGRQLDVLTDRVDRLATTAVARRPAPRPSPPPPSQAPPPGQRRPAGAPRQRPPDPRW